jgi:hypothetical protein
MGVNNINFNTDKIVIVYYPSGTGGKFLLNCLALGSNSVFQDVHLVNTQFTQGLSGKQKLQILLARLNATTTHWNDLGMGNLALYGFPNTRYLEYYPEHKEIWPFNEIIQNIIEHNNYFFLISHTPKYLEAMSNVWPNARLIIFENYDQFLKHNRPESVTNPIVNYADTLQQQLLKYWKAIRDSSWPELPPTTVNELNLLPTYIVEEINQTFSEIYRYFQTDTTPTVVDGSITIANHLNRIINNKHNVLRWDVDKNYNELTISDSVLELAKKIGIENIDSEDVKCYYINWKNTLQRLMTAIQNG